MPRYNRNMMSLNTVDFNPTVFNAVAFKPVEQDISILDRAMARQEERKEKAIEKQTAVRTALAQAREKLHRDDETLNWFDTKVKDIESTLNTAVTVGDYSGAINTALTLAGDLASDTELTARIRNNTEYEEKMKELDNMVRTGDISEQTAKYIRKQNPFETKLQYDNEGHVIGSDEWNFKERPVKDLKIDELFLKAFQTINPNTTSWGNKGDVFDANGKVITNRSKIGNNAGGNYLASNSGKTTEVKPEEILAQAKVILMGNPDWELQLKQMYGAAFSSYEDNEAKLKSMSEDDPEYNTLNYIVNQQRQLFYKDGIPVKEDNNTFMNFFSYQLFNSDRAKAYGYKISESNNSLVSLDDNGSKSGDGGGFTELLLRALNGGQRNSSVEAAHGSTVNPSKTGNTRAYDPNN